VVTRELLLVQNKYASPPFGQETRRGRPGGPTTDHDYIVLVTH
jgi:hypothetical protein